MEQAGSIDLTQESVTSCYFFKFRNSLLCRHDRNRRNAALLYTQYRCAEHSRLDGTYAELAAPCPTKETGRAPDVEGTGSLFRSTSLSGRYPLILLPFLLGCTAFTNWQICGRSARIIKQAALPIPPA